MTSTKPIAVFLNKAMREIWPKNNTPRGDKERFRRALELVDHNQKLFKSYNVPVVFPIDAWVESYGCDDDIEVFFMDHFHSALTLLLERVMEPRQ